MNNIESIINTGSQILRAGAGVISLFGRIAEIAKSAIDAVARAANGNPVGVVVGGPPISRRDVANIGNNPHYGYGVIVDADERKDPENAADDSDSELGNADTGASMGHGDAPLNLEDDGLEIFSDSDSDSDVWSDSDGNWAHVGADRQTQEAAELKAAIKASEAEEQARQDAAHAKAATEAQKAAELKATQEAAEAQKAAEAKAIAAFIAEVQSLEKITEALKAQAIQNIKKSHTEIVTIQGLIADSKLSELDVCTKAAQSMLENPLLQKCERNVKQVLSKVCHVFKQVQEKLVARVKEIKQQEQQQAERLKREAQKAARLAEAQAKEAARLAEIKAQAEEAARLIEAAAAQAIAHTHDPRFNALSEEEQRLFNEAIAQFVGEQSNQSNNRDAFIECLLALAGISEIQKKTFFGNPLFENAFSPDLYWDHPSLSEQSFDTIFSKLKSFKLLYDSSSKDSIDQLYWNKMIDAIFSEKVHYEVLECYIDLLSHRESAVFVKHENFGFPILSSLPKKEEDSDTIKFFLQQIKSVLENDAISKEGKLFSDKESLFSELLQIFKDPTLKNIGGQNIKMESTINARIKEISLQKQAKEKLRREAQAEEAARLAQAKAKAKKAARLAEIKAKAKETARLAKAKAKEAATAQAIAYKHAPQFNALSEKEQNLFNAAVAQFVGEQSNQSNDRNEFIECLLALARISEIQGEPSIGSPLFENAFSSKVSYWYHPCLSNQSFEAIFPKLKLFKLLHDSPFLHGHDSPSKKAYLSKMIDAIFSEEMNDEALKSYINLLNQRDSDVFVKYECSFSSQIFSLLPKKEEDSSTIKFFLQQIKRVLENDAIDGPREGKLFSDKERLISNLLKIFNDPNLDVDINGSNIKILLMECISNPKNNSMYQESSLKYLASICKNCPELKDLMGDLLNTVMSMAIHDDTKTIHILDEALTLANDFAS